MGWRDMLQAETETLVAPWIGGRELRSCERAWKIKGRLPQEMGWFKFDLQFRQAKVSGSVDPENETLFSIQNGYIAGDRFIPEGTSNLPKLEALSEYEIVHLVEPGLNRFSRVSAGRFCESGPLIFNSQEMPAGPEDEVESAFLDRVEDVRSVQGVTPALQAAFNLELWRRQEADQRRREADQRRREEEARLAREDELRRFQERISDGAGRREFARVDYGEAARAALLVGGAEFLDHRPSFNAGEMVVQFRFARRRFECVCNMDLGIIDSGICLTDEVTGRRDDQLLSLEALPSVIQEAMDLGKLVVFRHVD